MYNTRTQPEARRERILAELRLQPGLGFRELVRRTGMPSGSLHHHANILARRGALWRKTSGPRLLHFPGQPPNEESARRAIVASLRGLDAAIATLLSSSPMNQIQVLQAFRDVPESTVQHHLYSLTRRGLLSTHRIGRYVRYSLTTGAQAASGFPLPVAVPA
jgi:predicted transcriptional regulator